MGRYFEVWGRLWVRDGPSRWESNLAVLADNNLAGKQCSKHIDDPLGLGQRSTQALDGAVLAPLQRVEPRRNRTPSMNAGVALLKESTRSTAAPDCSRPSSTRSGQSMHVGCCVLLLKLKMETHIAADRDCLVAAVHVQAGDRVAARDLLIELREASG